MTAAVCEACKVERQGENPADGIATPPAYFIDQGDQERGHVAREIPLCNWHLDALRTRGGLVRSWRKWRRYGMALSHVLAAPAGSE